MGLPFCVSARPSIVPWIVNRTQLVCEGSCGWLGTLCLGLSLSLFMAQKFCQIITTPTKLPLETLPQSLSKCGCVAPKWLRIRVFRFLGSPNSLTVFQTWNCLLQWLVLLCVSDNVFWLNTSECVLSDPFSVLYRCWGSCTCHLLLTASVPFRHAAQHYQVFLHSLSHKVAALCLFLRPGVGWRVLSAPVTHAAILASSGVMLILTPAPSPVPSPHHLLSLS